MSGPEYKEIKNKLYALKETLRSQSHHSHNWQQIDCDLDKILDELSKSIKNERIDMFELYFSRIQKLVNERGIDTGGSSKMKQGNIFSRLFKSYDNKNTQIEDALNNIATKSDNPELAREIFAIIDVFRTQTGSSSKLREIDSTLNDLIGKLAFHAASQNVNTVNVYLEYITKLVNARAGSSDFFNKYVSEQNEQKLFDCKVQMYERIDNGNRLVQERDNIIGKLETTQSSDMNYHALVAEKEACEIKYNDTRDKVRALADQIYMFVTNVTGSDITFYEMLRKEQMSPEIYDDLTAVLEYHRDKHRKTAEENKRITEGRHKSAEPMPTLRSVEPPATEVNAQKIQPSVMPTQKANKLEKNQENL